MSSAGADMVQISAEALFERLLFLDGDGVWLLLQQTLDTARGLQLRRREGDVRNAAAHSRGLSSASPAAANEASLPWIAPSTEVNGRAKREAWMAAGDGSRGDRRRSRQGGVARVGMERELEVARDGAAGLEVEPWLPLPPSAALEGLVASRPSLLVERRSVFGAGETLAGECAPAAMRLLDLVNAGRVAEHM